MIYGHPMFYRPCRPRCTTKCVGTFARMFKLYKTSCYNVLEVCSCCGHEFPYRRRHRGCPRCGWGMAALPPMPPLFGGFPGFGMF